MGMALRLGLNLSTALSSPRGGLSAAWSANFLSGVLPAGVSVSSPSLGGLVTDSTGRLTYKPNNLVTYSNTFSNAAWTKAALGFTQTGSYWNAVPTTASADHYVDQSVTHSTGKYALTVVAKANGYNFVSLFMAGLPETWFNVSAGTVGTVGSGVVASISAVPAPQSPDGTSGWFQCLVKGTGSGGNNIDGVRVAQINGGAAFAGDGTSGVLLANATLSAVTYETTPRAADQVITGAQAYYGPAWDYDPVSVGVPLGLRIWEARTNYLLNSNGVSDATVRGATVTPGAIGPDGTASATSLTVGAKTSQDLYKTVQGLPSPSAFSFYIKRTSTSGTLRVENPYGTGAWDVSMSALPNRWERIYEGHPAVSVATSFASDRQGFWFSCGSGTVSFDFYGAQINDGSTASPYTPTGASAVTAAADDVVSTSLAAVGGFNANAGALVAEWGGLPTVDGTTIIAGYNSTTYNNSLGFGKENVAASGNGPAINLDTVGTGGSLSVVNLSATAGDDGSSHRAVATWNQTVLSGAIDGNAVATGIARTPTPTKLNIGSRDGSYYINGYARKLTAYASTLTNAQLVALSSWTFTPTWLGDFTLASLPAGVAVSSPSLGGLVTDATGKLTYKANNGIPYSNDLTQWITTAVTPAANSAVAPDGTTTANVITDSTASSYHYINQTASMSGGTNYIWAVYLKQGTNRYAGIHIHDGAAARGVSVDLQTGTLGTPYGGATASITPVANGWYLVSIKATTTASVSSPQQAIYLSNTNALTTYTGTGTSLYAYAATLSAVTYETAPRPQDQVITTAQAYYGPAWDYDPVAVGTPLGLRIWEQRTNLALYSQDFSNAAWQAFGGAAKVGPATGIVDPAGTQNAYELSFGAAGGAIAGASAIYQSISFSASVPYSSAVYMRAKTGTTSVRLSISSPSGASNDVGSSDLTVTTAWTRIKFENVASGAGGAGNIAIRNNTAGNSANVYVWQFDLNQAATIGLPTPTGASAVPAAADVVTLGGVPLALLQGAAFSAIAETGGPIPQFSARILGTSGNAGLLIAGDASTQLTIYDGTYLTTGGISPGNYSTAGAIRSGGAVGSNNSASIAAAGSSVTSATYTLRTGSVYLGSAGGSASFLNAYFRKLALYNTRLPDFALQQRSVSGASLTS